jgi:outer membrane lipase/esterase
MKIFRKAVLASAITLACASIPAAAQYSNLYVFGDSLSDAGTFAPSLPPGTGRFTTNPDQVWAQVLGSRWGFTVTPAVQGGTDYAQGGARVAQLPGWPPNEPFVKDALPVTQQVQQALKTGIDSRAMYALWAGANDVSIQLAQAATGQITPAQAQANVVLAATQMAQQVAALQAAGAQNLVVINLPDMGKTPSGQSLGPAGAAQLSALASLYNTTLAGGLNTVGGNVLRVDSVAWLNDLLKNPASYGITNTTQAACGTTPAVLCTRNNLVAPNANLTYAFADGNHPTGATHLILAQAIGSMIEGPYQMLTMGAAPLQVEQATFRTVDGRMWSQLGTPYLQKGLTWWAAYDYADSDVPSTFGSGSASMNTLSIGADIRVTPHMVAGGAFNFSKNDADVGSGGYSLRETSGTIYAGFGNGPWYAGASMLIGNLDYNDIDRSFDFGPTVRSTSGTTGGTHWAIRALGGYWFNAGGSYSLIHGPFGKLVYQNASIDPFSESPTSTTSLRYGEQDVDSTIGSLGWQVQGQWGQFRPFARATWEYEFQNGAPTITVYPSSGGQYTVTGAKRDSNWGLFNFGGSMDFGNAWNYGFSGYLMGTATAGKSDSDFWAITVGIRASM